MDIAKFIKPWLLGEHEKFILRNARIVDPTIGSVSDNITVVVDGGLISAISPGTPAENITAGVKPENDLNLQGKYICPGLIDCHVHIAVVPGEANLASYRDMTEQKSLVRQPSVLKSMLHRGFTSVRDCGGASLAMKEAVEEGIHPGPRLFIAGRALSQTGGHGDMRGSHDTQPCCGGVVSGISRIVDGVAECLRYARDEIRQGADFLKIMGGGGVASPTDKIEHLQFSDEEIRAIVTVAKNAGTYVTSHCYTPESIQQAIRQGVRGIEHGNLIDLETAKLMAETGTFLTPTLVVHAIAQKLKFLSPDSDRKNTDAFHKGLAALKMATDAGVTVCFGTDLLGPLHFAQSQEFSVRSQVQTPLQILQSATVNAAKLLMQEDRLGQVKEGFLADLLILDSNPLEDITVLDQPEQHLLAVMKDGRLVTSGNALGVSISQKL
ncbi:unnamed protein product [Clonostachys solani]|uniref:Amidohydrolase-related domain-containing protein n=1 Tax=Clonostachys solani TaxID=160281 RepID=A0A9N9YVY8_9HYPO|nr:unnamed protein product [Clonostachys solani]